MKVKDLQEVFIGVIWIMLSPMTYIKTSETSKYDNYEIEEITIGVNNSLEICLKEPL